MKHIIKAFVRASCLPEHLKEELAGDYMLAQHALYVELPTWLAPLFSEVRPVQVEQLSLSSYLYFRFLLVIDQVLDGGTQQRPARATQRLLAYCDLFERSVRGLAGLFPADDPFWALLSTCKEQYAASNLNEKNRNVERGPFTLADFEAQSAGKSAICNVLVYALSCLGGTTAPVDALLACLRHAHVALQCMDDVEDFRTDWEQGQYTYAHAQVESYLAGEGLDARALTGAQVHPYLYTSGTADALFDLGQAHFARAVALARPLGLSELTALLAHHVTRCGTYRDDIAVKLARGRYGAHRNVVAA